LLAKFSQYPINCQLKFLVNFAHTSTPVLRSPPSPIEITLNNQALAFYEWGVCLPADNFLTTFSL